MGNADGATKEEEDLFFFGKDDDFIVVDAREDDDDDDGATTTARAVDAFADAANMMCYVFCYGWMMFLSHFIWMRKVCGGKIERYLQLG